MNQFLFFPQHSLYLCLKAVDVQLYYFSVLKLVWCDSQGKLLKVITSETS